MNENGVPPATNLNSITTQAPIISVNDVTSSPMPTYAGATKNGAVVVNEPKRRVSIASDPVSESRHSYDNAAFDPHPRRKISQTSVHSHCEIGPVRRKSILMNASHDNESEYGSIHSYDNRPNGNRATALDSLNAKINHHHNTSNVGSHLEESWIYSFCLRCRGDENRPSWEPPHWQKVCPYPLCPSFRQFSRIISLILIGILIWCTAYVIIGDSAAPGGQLFSLVVLTVAANFGGWLISLTTLPRLIGMLLVGLLFQNVGWVDFSGEFSEVTAILRKFALTIILIRAGLEMEPDAFKKVWKTILKLGVIPWTVEACVVAVMSHYLLNIPWIWSFLLGSIIAAVSPAVVVPCLFRLRTKGYGVAKGIPTLIIAVAGIDDALSVAIFGIISSIMFSDKGMAYQISQAPVCIFGGLGFGIAWGYMSRFFPEKGDPYVVPLRTILLFTGGLFSIFGSEVIGYEGAGPLAVVFAAFVSNLFWCKQGWEIEDNPVSTAFEIFWMIFEPILFGITGSTVKISALDPDIVSVGIGCLVAGISLRILCTVGIAFGDKLNLKEKIFVALSWMSKATVQAALGPVAMKHLTSDATKEERHYAEIVQTISVLSIILTAPLGAILISISGTKLLTKTKQPKISEGWRRSHRPSLRDISIIDEEEEREDPELPEDKTTTENTQTNINLSNATYSYNK
ncbi:sodium/hydrogen exchanger 9B1 isoform X2 [Episyrphus balteatus]|nr:sodium/hydrogen exchanger 9B1 isoform X2 [Episyrphus balteatus]XP_055859227.1 sodium/hydrogen exchanger 9B1 isoform X2 [Episyrphus balteatus]XP_055859228.1 sodium/hydrogen exchanger 9B1 isoform X2 [Episyrphus balteatus]XP_055859229.1 sodium/hydrogen exchanger 9B1 isoform X2 [Episyrphus balteatus]